MWVSSDKFESKNIKDGGISTEKIFDFYVLLFINYECGQPVECTRHSGRLHHGYPTCHRRPGCGRGACRREPGAGGDHGPQPVAAERASEAADEPVVSMSQGG